MPSFRTAVVTRLVEGYADLQVLELDSGRRALLYPRYCRPAVVGDRVVVNTTAVDLALGTGGDDFVVWNLAADAHDAPSGGHIMKLRYTPAQSDVLAVESPESPHHAALVDAVSLDGMVVVAASLHSQLVPVVSALPRGARVAYVMTDGGALELAYSRTVRALRSLGRLAGTITSGHAMGGDLEAVTVHSALLAARLILHADVAVVGMGPGVVGTQTRLGTTALELAATVNAAGPLGGRVVVALRMSSGDTRPRHAGVSAHSLEALRLALWPSDVAVPADAEVPDLSPHRVVRVDCAGVPAMLESARLPMSHMGRGPEQDPLFFRAAAAAGLHAASLLSA